MPRENRQSLNLFVIMPMSDEFSSVYLLGIKTIEQKLPGWDIQVLRADTARSKGRSIHSHIRSLIHDADVVIADLTGSNPNVTFEAGLAIGTGKHVLLLTQEARVEADFEGQLRIEYSPDALQALSDQLVREILGHISEIVASRSSVLTMGPGRPYWIDPETVTPAHRADLEVAATEQFDLGNACRDRNDLEQAANYYEKAVEIEETYWEAKYQLALVSSRLRQELKAEELAREVAAHAADHQDAAHAWKAHNLLSGIYKRKGDYDQALAEARLAYDISHQPTAIAANGSYAHVVPIKNRAVLEHLVDNVAGFEVLIQELKQHPDCADIIAQVEQELGPRLS